jgi:hypothetical protein
MAAHEQSAGENPLERSHGLPYYVNLEKSIFSCTCIQGVQEFCASILYLVVLCQFLISDARRDSFEKQRARSRAQRGCFLDKSQK